MQKENFADDQEYDPSQWSSGLFTGYCFNCFTCAYATCFPLCAISSAKSQFDGSSYIFNFICFGGAFAIVRNYIRTGYGISGRVGMSDCVISTFCWPCVIAQLLNEGNMPINTLLVTKNDLFCILLTVVKSFYSRARNYFHS